MSNIATGTFTVRPRADAPAQTVPKIGRMALDKQWNGTREGQSVVDMLKGKPRVGGATPGPLG
ncbi:hypothetical protein [Deinococcus arenicola]|uniref:Uncharacterized protein n=1 Tax=Deinococcus arenicola TaxID=2994950 RepID=A0ABU4DL99_9DEIO|nr:hypothetical protein [Deinococcus sp. ZS9-10]MDV6373123.1 hypothetical protein [Deinococcus sp. ZS9-10]